MDFICGNLTRKIEKLDISDQPKFDDDQLKMLLKRCNKLTELSIAFTDVTDESVKLIPEALANSLQKINIFMTDIDFSTFKMIYAMPDITIYGNGNRNLSDAEMEELKKIKKENGKPCKVPEEYRTIPPDMSKEERKKMIKKVPILKECLYRDLDIAYPYRSYDHDECKSGFWEIKAKHRSFQGSQTYELRPYQDF